jgi:EpsI family protein
MRFLRHPAALAVSLLLVAQAAAYYLLPKAEYAPAAPPMAAFPSELGGWRMVAEYPVEEEVQKVLRADDTLNRSYVSAGQVPLNLFMAYFKSQKTGVAPHSPKNCLPGSGWAPLSSEIAMVQIPGRSEPLEVNRFIVARGTEKTLVLYWYQTAYRVIASEYEAKVWLVIDSLMHRRSDTAIVRVVAPLPEGREGEIDKLTAEFISAAFPAVSRQIPR